MILAYLQISLIFIFNYPFISSEEGKNFISTTKQKEYFTRPIQENTYTMQYLAELNEEAVHLISAESYEEALNWLNQAEEKISTLDKIAPNEETYIITVFYNIIQTENLINIINLFV